MINHSLHLSLSTRCLLSLLFPPASINKTLGHLAEPARRAATAHPEGPAIVNVSVSSQYRHGVIWRTPDDYKLIPHFLRDHISGRVYKPKFSNVLYAEVESYKARVGNHGIYTIARPKK